MTIKAVLFDLDQTLIDLLKMKREACRAAINAMINSGLKINKRTAFKKLMSTYFKVGLDSNIAFKVFLEEQTGKVDKKILQVGIKAYLKTKPNFLKPYPYVLETLKMLKSQNIKLGIVTDAPREKGMQRLGAMNITKFFDIIITFDDTGYKKQNEVPFKLAMKKLKLKPREILFVGDSFKRDINPAKKLGMKTLLVKRYQHLKRIERLIL
jgi:putative hydrolase of the HAD superfamily